MAQTSLDSILSEEKPAETPAPAEVPAAEVVERVEAPTEDRVREPTRRQALREKDALADGKVRDPVTGQFVRKTDEPEATKVEPAKPAGVVEPVKEPPKEVKPELSAESRAFLVAAQDERKKRQELEAEVARLRAAAPKEPAKDFWTDPDAALKAQKDELMAAVAATRVQTAETIAKSRYPDYLEKIAVFSQIAQQNPWLAKHVQDAPDPAEAAYRIGKNAHDLQQLGGMDAALAKERQETAARVRAEVEKELKEKAEKAAQERAAIPGSLSDARSTGGNKVVWNGPTSLDNILKG